MSSPIDGYCWPHPVVGAELPEEIPHAVGVIVINWNWCEYMLEHFISEYLGAPAPIEALLVAPMGNRGRAELLAALVHHRETDEGIADTMHHFLKCFDINRENRNLLAHSLCVMEHLDTDWIAFTSEKLHGPILRERLVPISAVFLMQVCEDTRALFEYAIEIDDCLRLWPQQPLPEKPPLPDKLTVLHPAQPRGKPRPRSSQP
jgi:hypothetical protein